MVRGHQMEKLVRVDRNGTKYFEDNECPKCGGKGYIKAFDYVEGGICFMCGGTGLHYHKWVERTPEYERKLAEQRIKRHIAKAPEANEKKLWSMGFENGSIYVVNGDTYAIKDRLKEAGARFSPYFGWFFKEQLGDNLVKVDADEVFDKDEFGYLYVRNDAKEIVDAKKRAANPSKSQHLHEVGDKVELDLKLMKIAVYFTHFSYYGEAHNIYIFEDADGNAYVWKTDKDIDHNEGDMVHINGKVKANDEYKGVKQTVLTRCKIA